jgi:hypothetical protein
MNSFENNKHKQKGFSPLKVIHSVLHMPVVFNHKIKSRSRSGGYVAWPENEQSTFNKNSNGFSKS